MLDFPVEANIERELTAPLLQRVLLTVIVAGLALSAVSTAGDFRKTLCLALGNTVVAAAMLSMARRGFLRTASVVVVLSLLLTTIYAMLAGEALYDDSLLIVPGIFVLSSLLLSPRWVLVIIVLALSAVFCVGMAQLHGLTGSMGKKEPFTAHYIFEVILILSALATFVHYLVTLMRRIIVEARKAHQSVRDILDATSEAIVIAAAEDGRIVTVNATALDMFGYSRDEFIGLRPVDLTFSSEADRERVQVAFQTLREGKALPPFEWLAKRKDGTSLWIEIAARNAMVAKQHRWIAVARDITRRRRLEQTVREAETFRAVGQLAGGVAHDFNNQLVGILGNAEFLREELSVDADLSACADVIIASGQRAADLTRQLLAFARRGRFRNVPVDVHQIIAEVIALGKRSIDKRISIEQHFQASRSTVLGDPTALQNALLNLLVNARDALPLGGVIRFFTCVVDNDTPTTQANLKHRFEPTDHEAQSHALVRFGDSTPPKDCSKNDDRAAPLSSSAGLVSPQCLEISVADTGVGVEPTIIERIFEPFFTTKEHGTGMGLAAVRGTVAEHHGLIDVQSEMGRGTRMRIRLPLCDESASAETPQPTRSQTQTPGRILVVDDETAVANVCKMALERGGFEVEVCSGGRPAVERCKTVPFDLILVDMMMPDIDGVEVLRRIRTFDRTAKIMLMTGNASESVEARLKEWPEVVVLTKPMMPKEILEAVRQQLC